MSEINRNDISYLGFDWVREVENAILDYLDTEILKCSNELPDNVDELIEYINKYLGGAGYPEVIGYTAKNCYEAIVSNLDLVEYMFATHCTSLGNELGDDSLFECSPKLGVMMQEYLINIFLNMSDDEYLNYKSSINPQVQVEGLQQAVMHNANEYLGLYLYEICNPIIPNPLDMSLEKKEMLIEGFKERGLSKRLGLSNEDNFLVPKQESLSSRSTQAKQISDEQQRSTEKGLSKGKDDRDKGLSCQ